MRNAEEIKLRFQPKGSMCAVCAKQNTDCSHLAFYEMLPVLDRYTDYSNGEKINVLIVKCSNFKALH